MSPKQKETPIESVALSKLEPEKAGFVIYGRNRRGQLCVLSTYVQGRFDDSRDKYYCLAKGSIDQGENALSGAVRETLEESGIDVEQLLGTERLHQLARNEDVTPNREEGGKNPYGVRVKHAYSQPSDFAYTSASGHFRRMQMFFIEVDNIEALERHVKAPPISAEEQQQNVPWGSASPETSLTAAEYTAQHGYPQLADMLAILRTGSLSPQGHDESLPWVPKNNVTLIEHPRLKQYEHQWIKESGRAIHHIETQKDWLDFCRDIERKHPQHYKKLTEHFCKLKGYFNSTGICGDRTFIKLDEKDRPLTFFFEGAEVIPLTSLLTRSARLAESNPLYRDAMWGGYDGPLLPGRTAVQKSFTAQAGGFLPRDGQTLGFSRIYSNQAARCMLHAQAAQLKWRGFDALAGRIGGLAAVLDREATQLSGAGRTGR